MVGAVVHAEVLSVYKQTSGVAGTRFHVAYTVCGCDAHRTVHISQHKAGLRAERITSSVKAEAS